MGERNARIAALVLLVVLIVAFFLLMGLFGALNMPGAQPTATVVAAAATATAPPATATATTAAPTATIEPTLAPSATATVSCGSPATPEPLWVDPVISPTDQASQDVSVTVGRGVEITVVSEAGTVHLPGTFTIAQPVVITVPLALNTTNHLVVSAKIEYAPGCFYTLQTRTDRQGAPLTIVQQAGGTLPAGGTVISPPSVTAIPTLALGTPIPPGTVFLKPFSQVFAVGKPTPDTSGTLWLYQASSDAPMQVLGKQGAFTHLSGQNGTLNFWTLSDNVVTAPPPAPQYDTSTAGQKVEFVPATTVFACEGQYPQPLILGACQQYQNAATGTVVQSVAVDTSVLYLVELNGKMYWVSANALKSEPHS